MSSRTLRPARSVALLVTALAVLAALLVAPSPTAAAPEDDPRAEQAKAALARVQELVADKPGNAADALSRQDAPDVTMAMRDLFLHKDALNGSDRKEADRVLARPNIESGPLGEPKYDGAEVHTSCGDVVCVHHVTTGTHQADSSFADDVLKAATYSHNQMREFRYRAPLPDNTNGSEQTSADDRNLPDIYLVNVGETIGAFGYTAPETRVSGWGFTGYVVVDNDFSEFCGNDHCSASQALALMQVTTAHEYFHAVQFGYDYGEDIWLMEGTATWIEDEIFDGVNDSVNFLHIGPNALKNPRFPIDHKNANWYGNWIWFRYLSERFGRKVVLKAWQKADDYHGGGRTPPDKYSVKAVFKAVQAISGKRGKVFWNREFAKFADANRRPWRFYDEAKANNYPQAPLTGWLALKKGKLKKVREIKLSRLASATYRIKPHKSLRKGWKLRVRVDGNTVKQGGFAIATIKRKGGGIKRVGFNLGRNGRKAKTLPFGKSKVKWVEVTVVNASTRNKCWLAGEWKHDFDSQWAHNTCRGKSKDNGRSQQLVVRAFR